MKNYTGNKAIDGVYHKIINEIPEFDRYFELFAGGAAIAKLLCKPKDNVLLNDLDKSVSNKLSEYISENNLKTWYSSNFNIFDILETDVFRKENFIFLDPPYLHETRFSNKYYTCELTDDEHKKLLLSVLAMECKIMIIHPKHDLYDSILKDWRKVEIKLQYQNKTSIECLYMNYPPPYKTAQSTIYRKRQLG